MPGAEVDPDQASRTIRVTPGALRWLPESPFRAAKPLAFHTTDNNAKSGIKCILLFVCEVRDHDF
ncbi:MAG: hypothetical protein CMQ69_08410 [Gammaproteobacteria bacterium]|nr:hypothetical protein [Gammaproteobacteria bacterium]